MIRRLLIIVLMILMPLSLFAQIRVAILSTTDKSGEVKYALKLLVNSAITTAISTTDGYEAYDRIDLSSVLDEQAFQRTGMVSDSEIHKIGEMTGASYVLIAEVAPMDESYLVATAKIVNVESAKIENSAGQIISVNPGQMEADCKGLTDKLLKTNSKVNPIEKNGQVEKKESDEAGHEYVDLGLSVKWATCNVGAEKPEEYGGYFAWGEIKTKSSYKWTNYRFRTSGDSSDNIKFNKYNTYNTNYDNGHVDHKTSLDLADDVAYVQWGGNWRMPTKAELYELIEYCTWTWTEVNGIRGYRINSIKYGYTDRSIFLPAAGFCDGTRLMYAGSDGGYMSSSLNSGNSEYTRCVAFDSDYVSKSVDPRYLGQSVRPVCP